MKITPNIAALAEQISKVENESREQKEKNLKFCWYMTVIDNPVIRELWDQYRRENGISFRFPPEDRERLGFELTLFEPAVRNRIAQYVALAEAERLRRRTL